MKMTHVANEMAVARGCSHYKTRQMIEPVSLCMLLTTYAQERVKEGMIIYTQLVRKSVLKHEQVSDVRVRG